MSLFDLPNEVLEEVLRHVCPDDIENFAGTCHLVRKLAAPVLKTHYELKSKYGGRVNVGSRKYLHPAQLLAAIIENPKVSDYVKSLTLDWDFNHKYDTNDERCAGLLLKNHRFSEQLEGESF